MNPSEACYAIIKEFERGPGGGFATGPYLCPACKWTVGWGHQIKPQDTFKYPISAEQADDLLVADVAKYAGYVNCAVKVPIHQCMFDALTSFVFNLGAGNFLGSTLLEQLNHGNYAEAADQILRWDKATNPKTQRKEALAGLTRRRAAERNLFLRDGIPS